MRNIFFVQFFVAAHGISLDSVDTLFNQLDTLFSAKPENADPNQADYSEIFTDITSNKQDEIVNIIKAIEDGSETFFADLITTFTNTFTGELLNTDILKQFVKDINMWFGDQTAETTIKNNIMEQLDAVMGTLSQVSLDSIRQNAIEIVNSR